MAAGRATENGRDLSDIKIRNRGEAGNPGGIRQISPYVLWPIWLIWLFFMVPSLVAFVQARPPLLALVVMIGGLVLFAGIYVWGSFQNAKQLVALSPTGLSQTAVWLPMVVLAGLGFALTLLGSGYGTDWTSLFYYSSGFVAGRLATVQAAKALGVLMLVAALAAWLTGLGPYDIARAVAFVVVIGVVTNGMVRAFMNSRELRLAQEEIAQLAVTNERLRIARDLHDLLGHNLSLIALKSELARRLIAVAPERAAAEIGDIENVARTTLQEVREAVASYRQPTLTGELRGATEILAAAGIAYRYEGDESTSRGLPPAVENTLAWAVREGVTNVVRHSRARHCTIRFAQDKSNAHLEVLDDGVGVPTPSTLPAKGSDLHPSSFAPGNGTSNNRGNGLRGLSERVAAVGGRCETSPGKDGGFRLAVSLPLSQRRQDVGLQIAMGTVDARVQQLAPAPSLSELREHTDTVGEKTRGSDLP